MLTMAVVHQAGVVSAQRYVMALHDAMAGHPNAGFVTYYSVQEIQSRGMTPILENNDETGCLIIRHGNGNVECAGLFSVAGPGTGIDLLKRTIQQYGVNYVEAFEGLDRVYASLGFKTVDTIPWNDDYAPSGWNYAAHGTPSVKIMKL